jgi:hypothetical protein
LIVQLFGLKLSAEIFANYLLFPKGSLDAEGEIILLSSIWTDECLISTLNVLVDILSIAGDIRMIHL